MIMPAFRRRPKAAAVVCRLLAGYGDLELILAQCTGAALASKRRTRPSHSRSQHRIYYEKIGLQLLYNIRGADKRITKARKVCNPAFAKVGLQNELHEILEELDSCRIYRNIFSHCLWGQSKKRGLFFVDMEEYSKQPGILSYQYRHASQRALEEIEMYYWYTMHRLPYLVEDFCVRERLYQSRAPLKPSKQPALKAHNVLLPYKSPN